MNVPRGWKAEEGGGWTYTLYTSNDRKYIRLAVGSDRPAQLCVWGMRGVENVILWITPKQSAFVAVLARFFAAHSRLPTPAEVTALPEPGQVAAAENIPLGME